MIKKRVREISLDELAGNLGRNHTEKNIHRKQRIGADDPYFSVLDSGRDILVWFRKHKDIKKELSQDIQVLLTELEKMLHKMQMNAINDEFDYDVSFNEYYFDMGQINKLLTNFRMKLKIFMRNEKFIRSSDGISQKDFEAYKEQLGRLTDICDRMENNIRIFMGELEKEYGLEPKISKETTLMTNLHTDDD